MSVGVGQSENIADLDIARLTAAYAAAANVQWAEIRKKVQFERHSTGHFLPRHFL